MTISPMLTLPPRLSSVPGQWAALRLPLSLGMCALGLAIQATAMDTAWPRFRGPNGTGVSEATTVPAQWTEKDYNWTVPLTGIGHSSPVVWDQRIYLTAGDPKTAQRSVWCLSTKDGRCLWQRDYASKTFRQNRDNSYATATPAADEQGVVVGWSTPDEVTLLALDLEGREVWRREFGSYVGVHGSGASPIIVEGLVVYANEQEDPKALPEVYGQDTTQAAGKSFLIALDRSTGQTRWQIERRSSQAPYSTPCLYQAEHRRPELIFTSTSHGLTAVEVATGRVRWEMDRLFRDRCVSSPVTAPGLVIAGDGYGVVGTHFVAVRPGTGEPGSEPAMVYELKKPVPLVPTPLVAEGRLYLWGDNGQVACYRVATGELVWRERVGAAFYGSPVWVNRRLYCVSREGDVFVVAAADRYELLARVPLGEPSHATPAVAGGVMYLRTFSRLFSLGGK